MNKSLRIGLIVAFVLLALGLAWTLGRHSRNGRALYDYQAQLRAKGEKLTLAEWNAARIPSTNDSQPAITNAALALNTITGSRLHPGTLDLRKYVGPARARVAWRADAPLLDRSATPLVGHSTPLTNTFWDEFAAKLPALEPPLQQLRAALADPEPDAGPLTNLFVRRVNFVALRTAAQFLMGVILCDVRLGHLEDALQDLEALAALARMERNEPTLVAQMIRVAITGLGTATTWEMLQATGWTEPQLARMQSAWQQVDLVEAVETGFTGERLTGEELWMLMRSTNSTAIRSLFGPYGPSRSSVANFFSDYVLFPLYKQTSLDADELFRLQYMQESVEIIRSLHQRHPWPQIQASIATAGGRLIKLQSSPKRFRYPFSLISIPNFSKAVQVAARNETERQLTIAAIAIKRFQLRHGTLPSNLNALVPDFLPALPPDPMSGKTLLYHPAAGGDFVLYSVGEDGQDDGGDPRPPPGGKFGLWEGPDAVWPSALTPGH